MNVQDVLERQEVTKDRMEMIFDRQMELMNRYHEIESRFRLVHESPVNLHDAKGQLLLKDFAWRTTEELAEAVDAIDKGDDLSHIWEEVADALHFLVEMGLHSGITPPMLAEHIKYPGVDTLGKIFLYVASPSKLNFKLTFTDFVVKLGMVCHTLKNKPWKQSQMLTDTKEYATRYIEAFGYFIRFCESLGMESDDLFQLYFKKSLVNSFRQRSNY